jgi:hypothetical protein
MKNLITLSIFFISLSLSGLVSACGPIPSASAGAVLISVSMPASPATLAISSARVRIVHTWTDYEDGVAYQHREFGLGTAVEPSVVLTHNHFDLQPESGRDETLTFSTPTGQVFTLSMSNLAVLPIDAGTLMIYLPNNVTLVTAPIGDQTALDQVTEGEWLTVDYWDDASQRFARGDFQIEQVKHGVVTLSDPRYVIRPGDSGGGIYLDGKLIGNTWALYADSDSKEPVGAFDVALLPAEVMRLAQAEPANETPVVPSDPLAGGTQPE